jgi:hypothetical protein
MQRFDPQQASDPEALATSAQSAFPADPPHSGEHGHPTPTSVREVTYKGRTIRIETTYSITVDGEPVTGHVMVNNDGKVHYHAIPNQEFESAVDMVKRVIDLTPPQTPSDPPPDPPDHDHGHHDHGDHG